jgi:hypothetical protein
MLRVVCSYAFFGRNSSFGSTHFTLTRLLNLYRLIILLIDLFLFQAWTNGKVREFVIFSDDLHKFVRACDFFLLSVFLQFQRKKWNSVAY